MSEGIKNQVSLQTHQVARRRPPLAIYTDRLVRQYVEHESAAYELISLCKPDALHSEGKRAEAYVHHHVIDYRPPNPGAPLRTMVLGVAGFVTALVWLSTGWIGIGVLIVGTTMGLMPPRIGIRRSHGMGIILVPIMLYTFAQKLDGFGFI